jgi:hypothetical protein
MFEKVKDFFYDISDVLLSIVIIAVMFYTISWKLSDTMSYTPQFNLPFMSSEAEAEAPPTVEPTDTTHVAVEDDTPSVTDGTSDSDLNDTGEVIDMAPSENTESDPGSSTPTTETSQAAKPESENINVITAKEISFIVPSGMLASKIIQKLEDEGLIDDRAAFTKRLSERKLDSKLRSGTFQLSTDMTYDQIINKLTGQ